MQHMMGYPGQHVTTDTALLVTFNQMKIKGLDKIGQSTAAKGQAQENNWHLACVGPRKAGDSPHAA